MAASGRLCADWYSSEADVQRLLGAGKTEVTMGWLYLVRFLTYNPVVGGQAARVVTQDSATAQFTGTTPFHASNWGAVGGSANPGCMVTGWRTQTPFTPPPPSPRRLDAGPSGTLTLPDGGTRTLARDGISSTYSFSTTDAIPNQQLFIPAAGGTFKFQLPGGADVGPVDATVTAGNPLIWNEHTTITNVSRTQPLTVTWRGGRPGGFVLIQGGSLSGASGDPYSSFGCTVPSEAGSFTVPRDILASMTASLVIPNSNIPTGTLIVSHFTLPVRFTATGLDHGNIIWETYNATAVNFQ